MEYSSEDIRDFIIREIYTNTGVQSYKSRYLNDLVLLDIGYYEISISINYKKHYIQIDVTNHYYNKRNRYIEEYNSYDDIVDIIDNVFKYIKPAKLY